MDPARRLSPRVTCSRPRPDALHGHLQLPVVRPRLADARADDLEGWSQLCPDCIGAAGDDGFRRMRLRAGLAERAAASRTPTATPIRTAGPAGTTGATARRRSAARVRLEPESDMDADEAMRAYYRARAPTYDDWYLRRGAYAHGPIDDLAWQMELDTARSGLTRCRSPARSSSWRPVPAGGRRCWPAKGSCGATTRCPRRSTWRAAGWSPTACGRTSTSAMRGPSRIDRSMPSSAASGSATCRGRASLTSCRSAPLAQAGRHVRLHRLSGGSGLWRCGNTLGSGDGDVRAPARRGVVPDPEGPLRPRRADAAPWRRRASSRRQ